MTVCRQKRQLLGWSQDKLAELAGVIQPYISDIELRRQPPKYTAEALVAVARVLGIEDPATLTEEVR